MEAMAPRTGTTWLDSLGEWAWPGAAAPALEIAPAAWVPVAPAPLAPPLAPPAAARRGLPRSLRLLRLLVLLAVAAGAFEVGTIVWQGRARVPAPRVARAAFAVRGLDPFATAPPATIADVRTDAAGSEVAAVSFDSPALGWRDTFLVYLPPGYRSATARRYPVLYLLHGDKQGASSFLRLGLQPTLDRLIAAHTIKPLIAVMLEADGLPNNWRNTSGPRYASYVGEVQRLTDRVLRTIPNRASRAIAGYSMGGFGAMSVALTQLRSYSVVESWEGFFNNLSGELAADRPLLARLPLHAFVYGGREDTVASPAEDAPWATAMRAAGADAQSALYPGGHSFVPLEAHLAQMLTFAGRALRS
jgi:S-formylglutathione hydrolase FrmB